MTIADLLDSIRHRSEACDEPLELSKLAAQLERLANEVESRAVRLILEQRRGAA